MTLQLDQVNYHKSVIHQIAAPPATSAAASSSLAVVASAVTTIKSNAEETSGGSGTVYEKNSSNKNIKQSLVNTNDLFRLATEATPMYIKNPHFNQKTAAPTIAARLISNQLQINDEEDKSFLIEPSPSGVTRIRINNFDAASSAPTPVSAHRTEYNANSQFSSFKPLPLNSTQPAQSNVHVEFNSNQHHNQQQQQHSHQINSYYPFSIFDQQQQQHSLMVNRLSTASATPSSYSNKMIDICTSPIKILNANSADQVDPKTDVTNATSRASWRKSTEISQPSLAILNDALTAKSVRSNLEKSKLIVVNVTPKANNANENSHEDELDEITITNSPGKLNKQPLETQHHHQPQQHKQLQQQQQQLNESVDDLVDFHHNNYAHLHLQQQPQHHHIQNRQQSTQTPITSMLKPSKSLNMNNINENHLKAIVEEKAFHFANAAAAAATAAAATASTASSNTKADSEILNLDSNLYYDNIIKLKQTNTTASVDTTDATAAAKTKSTATGNGQAKQSVTENFAFQPDYPFNFNSKLLEKLNSSDHMQKDQCIQFPTPSVDKTKLPRISYLAADCSNNTEAKTGFLTDMQQQAIETFYDGHKIWTATTHHKLETNEMPQVIDENQNKKKQLQVKIKLPNDNSRNEDEEEGGTSEQHEHSNEFLNGKLKKKKSQHGIQRCCLWLFLLVLVAIVAGIIIYFFAYDILIKRKIIFSNN